MKKMVLTYHMDPGHGWLEVPLADFMLVRADLKRVSPYSYCGLRGFSPVLFLEEDCDMAVFLEAAAAQGRKVEMVHKHYDDGCFIRRLNRVPEHSGS